MFNVNKGGRVKGYLYSRQATLPTHHRCSSSSSNNFTPIQRIARGLAVLVKALNRVNDVDQEVPQRAAAPRHKHLAHVVSQMRLVVEPSHEKFGFEITRVRKDKREGTAPMQPLVTRVKIVEPEFR